MYFPSDFKKDVSAIEYNKELKELLILEFSKLAGEPIDEGAVDKRERELLRLTSPNVWNIHNKNSMELEMETEFEKFMIAVSEHTNEKLDEITVFRFYALLGYIKDKNKPKKQDGNY